MRRDVGKISDAEIRLRIVNEHGVDRLREFGAAGFVDATPTNGRV
jgi:hypothetical protein